MPVIKYIDALEILDSRGIPTLQVTIRTDTGAEGIAAVPSGASTGENEAVELRVVRATPRGVEVDRSPGDELPLGLRVI